MANVKPDKRAIFCEALDQKSPAEMAKYLDAACGDDVQLRAQVEALLSAHGEVGNFLGGGSSPEHWPTLDQPITEQAGSIIGPYKLLQQIGEGSSDSGRPYFVMELVKGVPITEYCDEQQLTARQRLELFLPVCRAVQHAHQKGIIHRDLKPSAWLCTNRLPFRPMEKP